MKRPLALIPARKGSKGLPGKNTRMFAGKPLIAHTIEAAIASNCVDVFVSTDDVEVLAIAKSYNLKVDYFRQAHLADDVATMADVVIDALDWRAQRGFLDTAVCLLQPTSPLRTSLDISAAVTQFQLNPDKALFGVSEMWTHPMDCITISTNPTAYGTQSWMHLVDRGRASRRQDYEQGFFFINGAIYISPTARLHISKNFVEFDSVPFRMASFNTIDIDTERDFRIAEFLYTNSIKEM